MFNRLSYTVRALTPVRFTSSPFLRRYMSMYILQNVRLSSKLQKRNQMHISCAFQAQTIRQNAFHKNYRCISIPTAGQETLPLKSALRKFYLKVHPDFFSQFPPQQQQNQKSLADLIAFLDSAREGTVSDGVLDLAFFIRSGFEEVNEQVDADSQEKSAKKLESEAKTDKISTDLDTNTGLTSDDNPLPIAKVRFQTLEVTLQLRSTLEDSYQKYVLTTLAGLMNRAGIPCENIWSRSAKGVVDSMFCTKIPSQTKDDHYKYDSWSGMGYRERGQGNQRRRHWRSFVDFDETDDIGSVSLEEFLSAVASVAQEKFLLTRGSIPVSYLDETRLRIRGFKFVFQKHNVTTDIDYSAAVHREALSRFRDAVAQSKTFGWILEDDVSNDPRAHENRVASFPMVMESQYRPNYSTDLAVHKATEIYRSSEGGEMQSEDAGLISLLGARSHNSLVSVVIVFCVESTFCHIDSSGRLVLALKSPQEEWTSFFENPKLLIEAHDARMEMQRLQQHALATCSDVGFSHVFSEPSLRGHPLYLSFLLLLSRPDVREVCSQLFKSQPKLKGLSMRIHAPRDGGWFEALREAHLHPNARIDIREANMVSWPLVEHSTTFESGYVEDALTGEAVLMERLSYDADMGVLLIPADVDAFTFCTFLKRDGLLAVKAHEEYIRNEKIYEEETLSLKRILRLRALQRGPNVSLQEMIQCCRRLRNARMGIRYALDSLSLRIGHEYRYDAEQGWITIPHTWF